MNNTLAIAVADSDTRSDVFRLRHDVYSTELQQYPSSIDGSLRDNDQIRTEFIAATCKQQIVGFIGVTSPLSPQFSLDKHVPREKWFASADGPWFEIRTLTVSPAFRHFRIAGTLMYAAFRYVQANGANAIVSMGRREVIDLYLRFGFRRAGLSSQCGVVTYDLMTANISDIVANLSRFNTQLSRIQCSVDWQLPFGFASELSLSAIQSTEEHSL